MAAGSRKLSIFRAHCPMAGPGKKPERKVLELIGDVLEVIEGIPDPLGNL